MSYRYVLAFIVFVLSTSVSFAFEQGDIITVSHVCKNEQDVLALAAIDMEDSRKAGEALAQLALKNKCFIIPRPGHPVIVAGVLLDYTDSNNVHTQILEIFAQDKETIFYTFVLPKSRGSL